MSSRGPIDVRAVFFDFGGTLTHSCADLLPVFQRAARRAGTELPWEEFLRANEECWGELWPRAPEMVGHTPSFADLVHERALRRVGVERSLETLVQYIREEALSPRWHEPYPETQETLSRLGALGFSLHVISGHVDYLPVILQNLGWSSVFETVTFTQEVGCTKPDPRVFQFALRRAGYDPADTVYVGDSWTADYLGARGAGMAAVWLNRDGRPAPEPCLEIGDLRGLEARLTNARVR